MKKVNQWKVLLVSLLFSVAVYGNRSLEQKIHNIEWYENYTNFSVDEAISRKDMILPYIDEDKGCLKLYALSACLMDASTNRVLYEKDAFTKMPMASTTKIMTLLVVLENADLKETVTVSSNAAKQPDVQLNIRTGEQYVLEDLLYSLMLESHNDVAVAIAEHIGGSVEVFCEMMTTKAKEIGALQTQFKTPNGLDADGHYTTASDLAKIGSYAIQNEEFRKITTTTSYSFKEITKGRSFTVTNKDRFLYMMDGAIGIKTGFTGKAGYCFVGAIDIDGKTLVSVVLGSGWPPNKSYKWSDTKKLMSYGLEKYTKKKLLDSLYHTQPDFQIPETIAIANGRKNTGEVYVKMNLEEEELLLKEGEFVQAKTNITSYIEAPVRKDTQVGTIEYYVNDTLYKEVPVYIKEEIQEISFSFILHELLKLFFL